MRITEVYVFLFCFFFNYKSQSLSLIRSDWVKTWIDKPLNGACLINFLQLLFDPVKKVSILGFTVLHSVSYHLSLSDLSSHSKIYMG